MQVGQATPAHFRGDIQGLRAIGIALIVIFHIWVGRVSGGVDVLFVISAYLMTRTLVRGADGMGSKVRYFEFWGRVLVRIVPSAFVIIAVTFALATVVLTSAAWWTTATHAAMSLAQLENVWLMENAVDYLNRGERSSPFQHFWALSLQMQFFLVLPFFVAGLLAVRGWLVRHGASPDGVIAVPIIIGTASFAYALVAIEADPARAYFDPLARVWEFMAGTVAAFTLSSVRPRDTARRIMSWVGLVLVASCGFVIGNAWSYPGWPALWPVCGVLLLLYAGAVPVARSANAVLAWGPLADLGRYSFLVYLWHWPLLVFALVVLGTETLSLGQGLAIIALSVALASVSTRTVENAGKALVARPAIAGNRWRRLAAPYAIALLAGGAALVPVLMYYQAHDATTDALREMYIANYGRPVPAAVSPSAPPLGDQVTAGRVIVPEPYNTHCHATETDAAVHSCTYMPAAEPVATVAIVGGSHSLQWLPAFRILQRTVPVRLVNITKSACALGGVGVDPSCAAWNANVIDELARLRPDYVLTTSTRQNRGRGDRVPEEYLRAWRAITNLGIRVIAIRDNPEFPFDPPECIGRHIDDPRPCGRRRTEALSAQDPTAPLRAAYPLVTFIDMSDRFCGPTECATVIDGMLAYRDEDHLSVPFAQYLAAGLGARLGEAGVAPFDRQASVQSAMRPPSH